MQEQIENFCKQSGCIAHPAILPPKGNITRLQEKVEKVEAVVDVAINPQEVIVGSVWDWAKEIVFGWLRRRDKNTYRPKV